MRTVVCDVDLRDPRNKTPATQLEDGEIIETFTVPLSDLFAELTRLEKEGYALSARLGSIAMGIEIAKKFGLT